MNVRGLGCGRISTMAQDGVRIIANFFGRIWWRFCLLAIETICLALRKIGYQEEWSGQQDLNLRPGVPKTPALPGCAIPRRSRLGIHLSAAPSNPAPTAESHP